MIKKIKHMNWKKFKEDLSSAATSLNSAFGEVTKGISEEFKESMKSPVEKLRDALNSNPNMTEKEVKDFLDKNTDNSDKLSEKLKVELAKLIEFSKGVLKSEEVDSIKRNISKILKDRDVVKMKSALKMTSSLNDIISTTKECTSSIGKRVIVKLHEL